MNNSKGLMPLIAICIGALVLTALIVVVYYSGVFNIKSPKDSELIAAPSKIASPEPSVFYGSEMVGQVIWDPAKSSDLKLEAEIKEAFARFDPHISSVSGERLVVIGYAFSKMDSNFGSAEMGARDWNNQPIPVDGFEYLLTKSGGLWKVTSNGDEDFCSVLLTFPEDMLNGRREYYIGCFPER